MKYVAMAGLVLAVTACTGHELALGLGAGAVGAAIGSAYSRPSVIYAPPPPPPPIWHGHGWGHGHGRGHDRPDVIIIDRF